MTASPCRPGEFARLRRSDRQRTASSAPMSPCRIRRRPSPPATGSPPRAPTSARSTRCGARTARCAATTPTSTGFSPVSTNRRRAGASATRHAVVLGAGGAARAIVHGLESRRDRADRHRQSHARARRGAGRAIRARRRAPPPGAHCPPTAGDADLLVNTTIARHERPAAARNRPRAARRRARSSPTSSIFRWRPRCSRRRGARGLRAVGGLGMLLHQAAPGFERWFGARPEVTPELRDAGRGRHLAASEEASA